MRTTRAVILCCLLLTVAVLPAPPSAAATRPYTVTAKASDLTPTLGQRVTIRGKVSAKAAGRTVRLQRRYSTGQPWSTVRTARIRADGTYVVRDTPTRARVTRYRVVKAADSYRSRGVSPTVKVVVYGWRYLTDSDAVGSWNAQPRAIVTIAGVSYKNSVRMIAAGIGNYIEYDLGRKCRALSAAYGLTDENGPDDVANLEVLADGTSVYQRNFAVGERDSRTLDVTDVLRVTLLASEVASQGAGNYPAWGGPRALCTT